MDGAGSNVGSTYTEVERFGVQKALEGEELKPYQAELIRLQEYLETKNRRMIILTAIPDSISAKIG